MPLLGHIHAVSVVEGCKISHWTQHRGSSWFLYGGQHRCPCGRPIFRRCVGCEVCHPVVSTNKCGPLLQYRYMCTPGQECLWPRHCLNLMATVFIAHAKISYGDIMRVQKRQAVFSGCTVMVSGANRIIPPDAIYSTCVICLATRTTSSRSLVFLHDVQLPRSPRIFSEGRAAGIAISRHYQDTVLHRRYQTARPPSLQALIFTTVLEPEVSTSWRCFQVDGQS
jgi:hypothetical protein